MALTTTPVMIFATPRSRPASFTLHAPASNSVNVEYSLTDVNILDFEELTPGQSTNYEDFVGAVWAKAATATATLNITNVAYSATAGVNKG